MGTIRRAVHEDSRAIWALNELPNLGATADPSLPLELPPPTEPPAAFPDLEDVTIGFIDRAGEFLVSEHEHHLVGMGGYRPEDADAVEIMRVRVTPRCAVVASAPTSWRNSNAARERLASVRCG